MNVKIKTKTGISLIDCTNKDIGLYNQTGKDLQFIVAYEGTRPQVLGTYESEKRAQEILDEIEEVIDRGYKQGCSGIIIKMPKK